MKRNAKSVLWACLAATSLWAGQAGAAVLLSDNFNGETQSLNQTAFANWNVTGGSVDLIGTGFFDLYPGNGNYVDMAGSTGTGGTLTSQQSFSLAPGDSLNVQFSLGGSHRDPSVVNMVDVLFGNTTLGSLTMQSGDPLTPFSFSLTNSTGNTMTGALAFHNLTGGTQGAILDNVLLTSETAPVSEPATALLLALGLGVLGLKRHRKAHWY